MKSETAWLHSGHLIKEPLRGHLLSRAQLRFFVLTEDRLDWFENEDVSKAPKGHIPLAGARYESHGRRELRVISGKDQLVLKSEASELDAWVSALAALLEGAAVTERPSLDPMQGSQARDRACDTSAGAASSAAEVDGGGLIEQAAVAVAAAAVEEPAAAVEEPAAAVKEPAAAVKEPAAAVEEPAAVTLLPRKIASIEEDAEAPSDNDEAGKAFGAREERSTRDANDVPSQPRRSRPSLQQRIQQRIQTDVVDEESSIRGRASAADVASTIEVGLALSRLGLVLQQDEEWDADAHAEASKLRMAEWTREIARNQE